MATDKKYPKKDWDTLNSDSNWIDYGGSWLVKAWADLMWIIKFENKEDWGEQGYLCEVRLASLSSASLRDALKSAGLKINDDSVYDDIYDYEGNTVVKWNKRPDLWKLIVTDALLGYGATACLFSVEGEYDEDSEEEMITAQSLIDEAYHKVLELQTNMTARNKILDSVANKVGSTYRDIMDGDFLGGLRRKAQSILNGEDPEISMQDRVILEMYGATGGRTLGGEVETEIALAGNMLKGKHEED